MIRYLYISLLLGLVQLEEKMLIWGTVEYYTDDYINQTLVLDMMIYNQTDKNGDTLRNVHMLRMKCQTSYERRQY